MESDPVLRALTATTILVVTNLLCVILLLSTIMKWPLLSAGLPATLAWLVPLILTVAIVQYRLWIAGGRYIAIARERIEESPRTRRLRSILIWCYVSISALSVPAVGILLHHLQTATD